MQLKEQNSILQGVLWSSKLFVLSVAIYMSKMKKGDGEKAEIED